MERSGQYILREEKNNNKQEEMRKGEQPPTCFLQGRGGGGRITKAQIQIFLLISQKKVASNHLSTHSNGHRQFHAIQLQLGQLAPIIHPKEQSSTGPLHETFPTLDIRESYKLALLEFSPIPLLVILNFVHIYLQTSSACANSRDISTCIFLGSCSVTKITNGFPQTQTMAIYSYFILFKQYLNSFHMCTLH